MHFVCTSSGERIYHHLAYSTLANPNRNSLKSFLTRQANSHQLLKLMEDDARDVHALDIIESQS